MLKKARTWVGPWMRETVGAVVALYWNGEGPVTMQRFLKASGRSQKTTDAQKKTAARKGETVWVVTGPQVHRWPIVEFRMCRTDSIGLG